MQIIKAEGYRAMTDNGVQAFNKYDVIAESGQRENGFMTLHAANHWGGMADASHEWKERRKGLLAAGLI